MVLNHDYPSMVKHGQCIWVWSSVVKFVWDAYGCGYGTPVYGYIIGWTGIWETVKCGMFSRRECVPCWDRIVPVSGSGQLFSH